MQSELFGSNFQSASQRRRVDDPDEGIVSNFVPVNSDDKGKLIFRRVKKRVPPIQRSLAFVLSSLQGKQVAIELKNDIG